MLALTRKKGETIKIGDNIEVVILNVQGDQVKLGIIAPKSVPVFRTELLLQIQEENKEAAITDDDVVDAVKIRNILKSQE